MLGQIVLSRKHRHRIQNNVLEKKSKKLFHQLSLVFRKYHKLARGISCLRVQGSLQRRSLENKKESAQNSSQHSEDEKKVSVENANPIGYFV